MITAQHKFGQPFPFKPYAKHIYCANGFVPVAGSDTAFHDRIITIKCPYQHDLDTRFQAVAIVNEEYKSSWLNATIEGLKRLRLNHGQFSITPELQETTVEHRVVTDTVISWILENTEEDTNSAILRSSLYPQYEFDNDTPGQKRGIVSKKTFFNRLDDNQDLLKWSLTQTNVYDTNDHKMGTLSMYIGRKWIYPTRQSINKNSHGKWILSAKKII